MKVYICGIDGYIGWALALHLGKLGHEVSGCDNDSRKVRVASVGGRSVLPIGTQLERREAYHSITGARLTTQWLDVRRASELRKALGEFCPDAIVHLAEQPSAPYSQSSPEGMLDTLHNNVEGTLAVLHVMREVCPHAHLVKLGSMGVYGTPNTEIGEGEWSVVHRGREVVTPMPYDPGSWYHITKATDSMHVRHACRTWGIRATDIHQGVVYGTRTNEIDGSTSAALTRFDVDAMFGTCINRFVAQAAAGEPLTPYGAGTQRRGFIPLRDSVDCLRRVIENPADPGAYRVFNQLAQVYTINDLARAVVSSAERLGIEARIASCENPRVEAEAHYYEPDHDGLAALGYEPTLDLDGQLDEMLADVLNHRSRIPVQTLLPDVHWSGERRITKIGGRA